MKKTLITMVFAAFAVAGYAQEYKIITTVESIVPMGIGRSRITEAKEEKDVEDLTTERTEGNKSDMKNVRRKDIKIDNFEETKLLNFYSATGINFQNIASNDAVVSAKLNELTADGWELVFVTSGVESDAGGQDGDGIFITRYIFRRN